MTKKEQIGILLHVLRLLMDRAFKQNNLLLPSILSFHRLSFITDLNPNPSQIWILIKPFIIILFAQVKRAIQIPAIKIDLRNFMEQIQDQRLGERFSGPGFDLIAIFQEFSISTTNWAWSQGK